MIHMVSDLSTRLSQLEQLHAKLHRIRSSDLFDDVTFVSCDLQKLFTAEKLVNIVGQIDYKSRKNNRTDDRSHGITFHDSPAQLTAPLYPRTLGRYRNVVLLLFFRPSVDMIPRGFKNYR